MWNVTVWITKGLLNTVTRRGPAKPDLRLEFSNLTRNAVLARRVGIANHGATRRKGLLGRDHLPSGEGLWIVPCEAVHTVGMRFPMDLVYLDRNMRVRKVRSGVRPWRLSACLSAYSVLELPSGTISKTQIRAGDQLETSPANPIANSNGKPPAPC